MIRYAGRARRALLALPFLLSGAMLLQAQSAPVAAKKAHVTELHGYQRADDYFWLREKDNPEVLSYLAEEEAYANAVEAGEAGLRDTLYAEMLGRIKETDQNAPYPRGGFYYYTKTEEGKQYPIYVRRRGNMAAPEQITLDLNVMGEGRPFISISAYTPGDDGRKLAYTVDTTGFRQYTLFVKDLTTGKVSDPLANRVTSVSWANDGKTLFYTQEDSVTKRSYRFYRHELGSGKHDLVFEEPDELYNVYAMRTRSKAYILVLIASATTTEVRYLSAGRPRDPLRIMAPRIADQEYYPEHVGNRFYIRTNDSGRTFRLVAAPVQDPGRANWTELIPNRPETMLEDVDGFSDHLVTTEREEGLVHFRVRNLDAGEPRDVSFPEPTVLGLRVGQLRILDAQLPLRLHLHDHADIGVRLQREDRAAHVAQGAARAGRVQPGRVRVRAHLGDRQRRHEDPDFRSCTGKNSSGTACVQCCSEGMARTVTRMTSTSRRTTSACSTGE